MPSLFSGGSPGRWGLRPLLVLTFLLPETRAKEDIQGVLRTTGSTSDGDPLRGGDIWVKRNPIPLCWETPLEGNTWTPRQGSFST